VLTLQEKGKPSKKCVFEQKFNFFLAKTLFNSYFEAKETHNKERNIAVIFFWGLRKRTEEKTESSTSELAV